MTVVVWKITHRMNNANGSFKGYKGVSKSFRTESITKYTLTTINTREATQWVMAVKLTRRTHKIARQLHPVAELYHLQFSLQAASPETFGYTLVLLLFKLLMF
jgi:hypothetical protein